MSDNDTPTFAEFGQLVLPGVPVPKCDDCRDTGRVPCPCGGSAGGVPGQAGCDDCDPIDEDRWSAVGDAVGHLFCDCARGRKLRSDHIKSLAQSDALEMIGCGCPACVASLDNRIGPGTPMRACVAIEDADEIQGATIGLIILDDVVRSEAST